MRILDFVPKPPDWRVETGALWEEYEWLRALDDCAQDPIYHGEGDVGTHLRIVLESLAGQKSWQELPEQERQIVFLTALFHDVAKPACSRRDGIRISSHGHSARGAIFARSTLWQMGCDFATREAVCGLVRHHQVPMHGIDRPDIQRVVFRISQSARCDLLAIFSEADIRGRITAGINKLLDNVELFRQYTIEQECFDRPRQFASDHSRFLYFRTEGRDPNYLAHDDTRLNVTIMSGLPGAGKDTWIAGSRSHLPVVAPDGIRRQEGISAAESQGPVISEARRQAREYLRSRTDFVWNATNLSREIRSQVIALCADYHSRIELVYVEAQYAEWQARNETRQDKVPASALNRMLDRWELPDLTEAHELRTELTG